MRETSGPLTRTNSQGFPRLAPKIYRFTDLDQYRTAVRNLDVEFTPLVRRISAEQIILNLPGCDINFAKSFPRIAHGRLAQNSTAIGFSMDDGVPIRFNGAERDHSAIVIGSNGAAYTTVERAERQFTSIIFTPEIRGSWLAGSRSKLESVRNECRCAASVAGASKASHVDFPELLWV
ncbi:hypothetical protein [Bradyrhizobium sp. RDM4]|uniref:hypothetical protein n=1 Tax=Bradyrhizobium sp. RDM4 TaxID=3378765 RepID=UPI0038FCA11B